MYYTAHPLKCPCDYELEPGLDKIKELAIRVVHT